jgi:hypothetical protein
MDAMNHRIDLPALRKAEKDAGTMSRRWQSGLFRHEVFLPAILSQSMSFRDLAREVASYQTQLDHATLACALERFRLARGQFPQSLEALPPDFLTRVPRDVLHGQPPKYRPTQDGGYILYSLGWDGADHGGAPGKDWLW